MFVQTQRIFLFLFFGAKTQNLNGGTNEQVLL